MYSFVLNFHEAFFKIPKHHSSYYTRIVSLSAPMMELMYFLIDLKGFPFNLIMIINKIIII